MFFSYLLTRSPLFFLFFFFNDTATTEIYTLSLHDALPIYFGTATVFEWGSAARDLARTAGVDAGSRRSEEHTSELQSHLNLVCRLLLEKKKQSRPCVLNIELFLWNRTVYVTCLLFSSCL